MMSDDDKSSVGVAPDYISVALSKRSASNNSMRRGEEKGDNNKRKLLWALLIA